MQGSEGVRIPTGPQERGILGLGECVASGSDALDLFGRARLRSVGDAEDELCGVVVGWGARGGDVLLGDEGDRRPVGDEGEDVGVPAGEEHFRR